ncbi:hypothetical protein Taro_037797 [Colocasia esculenta]|uniref:Uncharacterized protein n=1 Tax=Colocasia esculenta TaxID=4460 RepID=A0A843W6I5_COLES|nr:hypothetical protein [Colocasia esculenta]
MATFVDIFEKSMFSAIQQRNLSLQLQIPRPKELSSSTTKAPGQEEMGSDPVNVNEFEELARKALPKMYYDFFSGGAEDQFTLKENIQAFQKIT